MVDLADVPQMTMLVGEKQSINIALDNLEQGGRIVGMRIAPKPPEQLEGEPPRPVFSMMGVEVPTVSIDYPPQMVDAIKQALTQRRDAIAKELSDMGVTGMENRGG